jgi:protein gp37
MAIKSSIEWTESTWNPITGCTKVSSGCLNCYAERMSKRLQAMGNKNYKDGFQLACHPDALRVPLRWKKSQMIFVNSMSDTFHQDVSESFIKDIFGIMNQTPWHTYQLLTKRSERMADLSSLFNWSPNIWMGVTVENQDHLNRIDDLRNVPSIVKYLSLEPLLGPLDELDLSGINWVIVGGESGPGARPMKREWVESIRDKCVNAQVPFFFKQWGGVQKKKAGRILRDRTWDEMPVLLTE